MTDLIPRDPSPQPVCAPLTERGNISQVSTASRNGVISPQGHSPGAYTLLADCTGTMLTHVTPERDVHWNIYVARDGSEGVAVRSDDGTIGILTFKRQ